MREFELYTKDMSKGIHAITGEYGRVRVFIHKNCMSTGESYLLENFHYEKLASYKSVSALIKYAKANQFFPPNQIQQSAVTSCPVPAPAPAKSAAKGQGILFVEFQTSGRGKDTEIIEISVVDSSENVLFQSLIKPTKPIKEDSTKQHGINNAHVIESPSFADVWKSFSAVIGRSDIAFYNADFSKRIILQSIAKAFDTPIPKHFYTLFPYNKVICVGEQYKDFNNFRLGYFRNNGLQHINSACGQSGVLWRDLSKSSSGSAIKSARLYKYLDHKAVA